jgi:hypothetical protein
MGELFDAPNKEAVGLEPPWVEGTGGTGEDPPPPPPENGDVALDDMTKDELLAEAQSRGLSPANAGMSKAELRAVIDKG